MTAQRFLTVLFTVVLAISLSAAARADDESPILEGLIDVGGAGLGAFGISFDGPAINLYVLADQTNASVDLIDSESATFSGRFGSECPAGNPAPHFCFQGVVLASGRLDAPLSGPNGVVIVGHKEIWTGDGDSRIKVIDLQTQSFVTTISTGGQFRVDEVADDSRDNILVAVNNADSPPFVTLFDTATRTILGKMVFNTAGVGVDAENGIEQPQWSPATGLFYVSVPQVGSDPTIGGVSVINPSTMLVTRTLLVRNCAPAGLALGPHNAALIGCSGAFGSPLTTHTVIIDITSTSTAVDGAVVATFPIGGSDEVWYDKGTNHYFLAARNNRDSAGNVTPVLGSVSTNNDVRVNPSSHELDPSVSTSTTAHSVAADQESGHVFVPIGFVPPTSPAGTDPTNPCPTHGCVAVYQAPSS